MDKFRILVFSTYAKIGGTQKTLLDFFQYASHDRFTYYHCVLLAHDILMDEIAKLQPHIPQTSFNMRGYWDIRAWWKLYHFAKDKRLDLMHTNGLKADIIGRCVGRLLGVPVNIASIHSTDPWRKWYHVWLDRYTSWMTDMYLANSEAGRLAMRRRERISLPKMMTISNGIDFERFDPDHIDGQRIQALREEFGILSTTKVLGMVANLCHMKEHKTLIDALPRIHARFPNAICVFVGIDRMHGEIQRYVNERGCEQSVIFAGFQKDIPEWLALMDIFLLPSLWEGLPNAMLEAMAMRRPVIATPVGDVPEILTHGETGLLIPTHNPDALADAVILLLKSPEIAFKIAEAGQRLIREKYSIQTMVAQTEQLYERLILAKREKRQYNKHV
ncbi:putative Glycosyl transferase, group 1 [Candidatus Moduliflexus flocculans]|uniref:Putative Glycosyl transferase, group 1 n=1 Tax=Candidatus Moduliflexus flocculans TaxID=1499966 RepID=A0A081BNE1_9BACT|nr:putative Glycosyl transferase, group 1 [Candidatus Moduliflexus flocculans]